MTKYVMIAALLWVGGCATVGFSPEEMCARDGMAFTGRHYESGSVGNVGTSSEGIQCGRPSTKEERCEVRAARASYRAKVWGANCGSGFDTHEPWSTPCEDQDIEHYASLLYEKCMSTPTP